MPHACKAKAVEMTLTGELSPLAPATMLKTHPDWTLYIDAESAANCIKII